jgi:hypothetical protein
MSEDIINKIGKVLAKLYSGEFDKEIYLELTGLVNTLNIEKSKDLEDVVNHIKGILLGIRKFGFEQGTNIKEQLQLICRYLIKYSSVTLSLRRQKEDEQISKTHTGK